MIDYVIVNTESYLVQWHRLSFPHNLKWIGYLSLMGARATRCGRSHEKIFLV